MNQLRVSNRLKAIKRLLLVLGSFNIKKIEIYLRALFYKTFLLFICFLSHLETGHFSYRGSVNDKPPLQLNEIQ